VFSDNTREREGGVELIFSDRLSAP
jgi:hypothetical protein